MYTPEQFAATHKANLDMLFGVSNSIVESVEKLTQLNMQAMRSAMDDTLDQAKKSLSVKEPHEWLELQAGLVAPTAEKIQAYSRQLAEIVTATRAEIARLGLAQWEAYGNQARTLAADVAKGAPAGSEVAMAALNSAMTAANTLYETLQRTGQQAVEVTRSGFDMAAVAAAKSVKRGVEPAAQATKR